MTGSSVMDLSNRLGECGVLVHGIISGMIPDLCAYIEGIEDEATINDAGSQIHVVNVVLEHIEKEIDEVANLIMQLDKDE